MNIKIFGMHKQGQRTKDQLPDNPEVLEAQLRQKAQTFMQRLILLLKKKEENNT